MPDETPNVPVQTVVTTLRIIEYLHEHSECGVSEIAEALPSSKSTVHNHLQTLRRENYVIKTDGQYGLGYRFLDFAGAIRQRDPMFGSVQEKVRELAEETGEITQFVVDDGETAVVMFIERGAEAAKTNIRFGQRVPIDEIVAGRVISEARREELTGEISESDCLVDNESFVRGLRSIAAPLSDVNGSLHGALSVSGPAHRFRNDDHVDRLTDTLLNAINELELDVSYSRY
jgi:DNA-binding IclR family transcriptional regulator